MSKHDDDDDDDHGGGGSITTTPAVVGSVVSLKSGGLRMTVTAVGTGTPTAPTGTLSAVGISWQGVKAEITLPRELFSVYKS